MALTYSPTTPLVGDTVTLSQTLTVGGTAVVLTQSEAQLTAKPDASELDLGLIVDGFGEPIMYFDPDVPGVYSFKVVAFKEQAIANDFGSGTAETVKFATSSETVDVIVGEEFDLPIVTQNGHGITLRVIAHDDLILTAELVDPTTEKARLAALDATVLTKLEAIEGETASTSGPALMTAVATLGSNLNDHFTESGKHTVNDTVNAWEKDAPLSMAAAVAQLNEIRDVLVAHLLNASTSGIRWHSQDDTKSVPISPPADSLASATQLYADLAWRCYERHRVLTVSPTAHAAADNTNVLGSIDLLSDLIVAILDFLADDTPTVPTSELEAGLVLDALYGFTKVA